MRVPSPALFMNTLRTPRFALFVLPLFFVFFADAILSYTFPIIAERQLGSNTLLGVVMALSSVAGILCDFTFPTLLRGVSWQVQVFLGVLLALLFSLSIHASVYVLPLFFAVLASVIWGVYFELLVFAEQEMVVAEEDRREYARSWGILYATILFTSVAGPVIGAQLLLGSMLAHTATVLLLQSVALCFSMLVIAALRSRRTIEPARKKRRGLFFWGMAFLRTAENWKTLSLFIFPLVALGVMTKWIDATYLMFGGLFGQSLGLGGFSWILVFLYTAPFMFGSALLARFNVREGKKYLSQIALFTGGMFLGCVLIARDNLPLLYLLMGASSFCFSFAAPLNDAVYSDLIDRLRVNKLYLVGLAKANSSIAYIFAPIVMGLAADATDYYVVFGSVGLTAALIALILLVVTPRKLRLPQAALESLQ